MLTSTLFPPTQPVEGADYVSKTNGTLKYVYAYAYVYVYMYWKQALTQMHVNGVIG